MPRRKGTTATLSIMVCANAMTSQIEEVLGGGVYAEKVRRRWLTGNFALSVLVKGSVAFVHRMARVYLAMLPHLGLTGQNHISCERGG